MVGARCSSVVRVFAHGAMGHRINTSWGGPKLPPPPRLAYSCVYWICLYLVPQGARCSSVVRAFAHGAMGRRIDPSWGGPIELFLVPA